MLEAYTYDANGNRGRAHVRRRRPHDRHARLRRGGLPRQPRRGHVHLHRPRPPEDGDGRRRARSTTSTTRPTGSSRAWRAACARSSSTAPRAAPFRVTASRTGGELTQYFYDHTGLLIALERGGARFYVGTDQVGTPRVVTDADGAVVKTFATNAFGVRNTAAETGTFELAARLRGRHRGPGHGPRALRPARLRAGHGPLHREGPDPARGRHEPVRVRRQQPGRPSATRPAWTRAAGRHRPVAADAPDARGAHRRPLQQVRRVGQERGRSRRDRDRRRASRPRATRSSRASACSTRA